VCHAEISSDVCVEEGLEGREGGSGVEVGDGLGEGRYVDMGLREEVVAALRLAKGYKHRTRTNARFFCVCTGPGLPRHQPPGERLNLVEGELYAGQVRTRQMAGEPLARGQQ
jgi:hypothetical protein